MDELQLKREISKLREELDRYLSTPKCKEHTKRLLQLSQRLDVLVVAYYKYYSEKQYN
ncbi:Spo0E family sporulation regulatory protein-aspartic acid phosphatase [Caldanaerobius polysaccharolyticus]|uniref:Spo0E family sporulation regulatory protein-aspartic acid phosphatase n=1 Tax=Caldanaerobius polysaccharolyticus TaxID=44256 RepID=UPI000A05AC41|nr:Spo0E family sporulation regulatory protein-aspartic acid phosphatase [Caldanaerobius polysaccharolyticus]